MNRNLKVSAVCSMIAFAFLYVTLNRAETIEGESNDASPCTLTASSSPPTLPSSNADAELVLSSLRDTYVERWNTWEESRFRVLSRAAPSRHGPTSVDFLVSPKSIGPRDAVLLATISIRQREQTHTVPCVVDPATGRVRLFHAGNWLTEDEWLHTAPPTPGKSNR